MNFKNLSLSTKIIIGAGVPLILLALLGLLSHRSLNSLLTTSRGVDNGHRAVERAMELEKIILDMEVGEKGYLISGKDAMLARYRSGEKELAEKIAELRKLTADSAGQRALLDEIATLTEQWKAKAAIPEIDARKRIDMSPEERRQLAEKEGDKGWVKVAEVLDPGTLKQYQLLFSQVTGLKNMVAERDGSPVKQQDLSTFTEFCFGFVRNTEEGARRCQINDAEGGRVSGETGKPYAYECHAGLIDFAVPIIVDGRQIGSWLGGQVLTHAPDIANTRKIAREIGVDPDQLVRAIRKIPVLSREKIDQSMELLSLLAKTMSRLGNDQRLWTVMTDLVESGTGTNIMNSIREKLDLFIQTEIEHMQTIEARANSTATTTKFIILAAVFVAMIIGILVSLVILRSITGPVIQAMDLAERLGRGDFSRRLNLRQKDEIGRLSESLDSMADILEKHENELKENLDTMHAILTQVGDIAVNAHGNARALADSGQTLSQAATEQASSLEEISSSLTEIGGQTKTSADNAQAASALSEQSHNAADAGTSRMNQMVDAMGDIFEASRNIAKITKVIDEIAFQTNLLSLNAAVEAARAGQHGKGFAVVAEEVRNLAVRSARAAHEISDLIENSVGKVENGNRIASETAEALADIVEATAKTAAIVKEISMASKEQATGIEQITEGLSQVDGVTHLVTSTAEETASASEELTGIAGKLREILQRYEKGSPQAAIDAPETPDEMIRLLPASAPERWEEQTGS